MTYLSAFLPAHLYQLSEDLPYGKNNLIAEMFASFDQIGRIEIIWTYTISIIFALVLQDVLAIGILALSDKKERKIASTVPS